MLILSSPKTSQTLSKYLHLQHIQKFEKKSSLFSTPRILLGLSDSSQLKLIVNENRDAFFDILETQLKKKSWLNVKKVVTPVIETGKAGLAALKKAYHQAEEQQTETLKQAFQDIDSLMEYAKDLVQLAEKFSEKTQKLSSSAASSSTDPNNNNSDNDVKDFLIVMGISSPVTKRATGTLYHQQLSRQLADFLPKHLEKTGMMTLVDAYCIYNRARGTDLISPEDMYRACALFEQLHIDNVKLKKFDSGVLVIQLKKHNDEEMAKEILNILQNAEDSITPLELSKAVGLSVVLAKEQLQTVESLGMLCRDESIEGIRFYKNLFSDYKYMTTSKTTLLL